MINNQEERKGFVANSPVEKLKPIEALALLNRWMKLKSYFYYDDLNTLYDLKDEKIVEFVRAGELVATAVIVRESPAIAAMRVELSNGGQNLDWLGYSLDISPFLSETESTYVTTLHDMTNGSGIEVEYPQDIYDRWMQQLQPKVEAYQVALADYNRELQLREPLLTAYSEQLSEYQNIKSIAAQKWAKENSFKIARTNSGKSLKKDWLKRLEKQGFHYEPKPPVHPFPTKLQSPQSPKLPPKTYSVDFETYVPGSIPEIESALNWCRSIVGDAFPKHTSEIDDHFVCWVLENALREIALDEVRQEVLTVFKDIVEGDLTDPKEIWDKLTDFEIDYCAIGMEGYINSWNETSHRDFSKWHEINFSSTGHWLIEFQSTNNPDITFHLPYNRRQIIDTLINVDALPNFQSEQAKFGREISASEQQQYPIIRLLEVLGASVEEFPYQLKKYTRLSYADGLGNWEDEDWTDDDDEDEFF